MSDCCARPGLLAVEDARARLLAAARVVSGAERVALEEALGRVLAEDVLARVDVPPADNSAMDGFALRLDELRQAAGHRLAVSQRIPAGSVPARLSPGTAARIFTGAEIPEGADVVVMQEDCEWDEAGVTVAPAAAASLAAGDNVRPRGQDMQSGSVVLKAGSRLGPAQLGVAAAAGHGAVPVVRRLRVAVLSTGDELLEPGEAPLPGRIYNSNRYALKGYLAALGCEVIDIGVVVDRLDATVSALRQAADGADLVLTTGGASVGEEDHLQAALRTVGRVDLWKIAIKPGKPLMFGWIGRAGGEVPLIGLPGNPVSVAVTFLVFAAPFISAMQGGDPGRFKGIPAPAGFSTRKAGDRTEYLRVRLEDGRLVRHGNQSSGVLTSMAWADGLAVIPATAQVAEGQLLQYFPFDGLLSGR